MRNINFIVNNELVYDQRMIRICTSLSANGYNVLLIGKKYSGSVAPVPQVFRQRRISCYFKTGKKSYLEYNIKLFLFLLFNKSACLCAIDLDTIFPVLFVSWLKKSKRIYDAHELFTEMKEIVSRPVIQKIWNWAERNSVPYFKEGYTVSESIAGEFHQRYSVNYSVVRNIPRIKPASAAIPSPEKYILYQGAVNYGRCLEYLIPAMKDVHSKLIICGNGNFMTQARKLVDHHQLTSKVIFKGMLLPEELYNITASCYIGINLVEPDGLNQLYSLANKFFDYIHAGIPQLSMNFIEYARINNEFKVAVLIPEPQPSLISSALNLLLENDVLYRELKENCIKAREIYNWQKEEKVLLGFYNKIFN